MNVFDLKKRKILKELSRPQGVYSDRSPKGSVDVQIRDLVNTINSYDGLVTTSSCSGRISVFVDGSKDGSISQNQMNMDVASANSECHETSAASSMQPASDSRSGKGPGGKWLYVSHQPVDISKLEMTVHRLLGFDDENPPALGHNSVVYAKSTRLIHFKFEPMILHVLAADVAAAHDVLASAHQAGFRESGASSLEPTIRLLNNDSSTVSKCTQPIPIAVRTSGIAFDNVIGFVSYAETTNDDEDREIFQALVSDEYLRMLLSIANDKFSINADKSRRFGELLADRLTNLTTAAKSWEDSAVRKDRKRREGLERQKLMLEMSQAEHDRNDTESQVDELLFPFGKSMV